MKYFVIVYDTEKAELRKFQIFDDGEKAQKVRSEYEREHAAESVIEVVLLRAASEEAIQETHPRYFADPKKKSIVAT
jgi:hypothetical protein